MVIRNLLLTAIPFLCALPPAGAVEPSQPRPATSLSTIPDVELNRDIAFEESEFAARFNNLVRALQEFSTTYKSGHVINVKSAKAVRKAMRDLEKSDWFHAQKGD